MRLAKEFPKAQGLEMARADFFEARTAHGLEPLAR